MRGLRYSRYVGCSRASPVTTKPPVTKRSIRKTIGGLDVRFVKPSTTRAQKLPRFDERTSSGKVHTIDRRSGKRGKLERPRATAQLLGVNAPTLGKPYGFLLVDLNPNRPVIARRPENELDPIRGVAPLPCEQKRLLRS